MTRQLFNIAPVCRQTHGRLDSQRITWVHWLTFHLAFKRNFTWPLTEPSQSLAVSVALKPTFHSSDFRMCLPIIVPSLTVYEIAVILLLVTDVSYNGTPCKWFYEMIDATGSHRFFVLSTVMRNLNNCLTMTRREELINLDYLRAA